MDRSGQSVLVAGSSRALLPQPSCDLLYRAYAGKILRTARRITRNYKDAEDAVQETFLNAFRHIQTFDGRSAFSTWLTRIGINSALMLLRKKRNSREVTAAKDSESESPWEATDPALDPEQQSAEQERLRLLRGAIARLRPSIRCVLEIHTLHGRSVEEMASEIGISVCAAKGRLFHARAPTVLESAESTAAIKEGEQE